MVTSDQTHSPTGMRFAGLRLAGLRSVVAEHLRDPMRRSSYALVLGTGLTSALGLVFWALAARWLPPATVGIGAALVSAMALLANVSTLGLRNGLIRFLPTAGASTARMIISSYLLCGVAAAGAAGVFLLGQPLWADRLGFLRASPLAMTVFVVGTACWVIFVLQDHVLVGLRKATWVPLENGLCAVAKIALLPLLAVTGSWAVFGAAVLPAAAAVVVVTTLVLRYLRRQVLLGDQQAGDRAAAGQVVPVSGLVRFAAADHFAALLWMGTSDILTLLVLHELGPESSAYYFMAATIGYTLNLFVSNVSSAFVAEAAHHPERSVELARQSLWNAARLVVPLAAIGVVVAPLVLDLLGRSYADGGTTVLRLLLVAAVPQVVVGIALGAARVRRDLRMIMAVYAALAIGSIGGSWLTLDTLGLTGVGVSCLVSQIIVCLAVLITGRTGLFHDRGVRSVIGRLERMPQRLRRQRSRQEIRRRLAPALAACGLEAPLSDITMLTSDSDTLVVALPPRDDDHDAAPTSGLIMKIATSDAASYGLGRHVAALTELRARLGSESVADLLPRIVLESSLERQRVVVETRLPGTGAGDRLADPATTAAALRAATAVHQATRATRSLDGELLARWVDEPVARLRGLRSVPGGVRGLERLRAELHQVLLGRGVVTSWVHGDFWSGNVLITEGIGGALEVSGIADWENAEDGGLPDADLLHWWLAAQPVELGAAVRDVLVDPAGAERRLAESMITCPTPSWPSNT